MDVRNVVETTFEDGETKRRNIGRLCRAHEKLGSESLGLRIVEASIAIFALRLSFLIVDRLKVAARSSENEIAEGIDSIAHEAGREAQKQVLMASGSALQAPRPPSSPE